jgi:hypothetical protein
MRFVFGRGWVFCDETNGEGDGNGDGGGGAGGTGDAGGGADDDAGADAGADDAGAAGAKDDDAAATTRTLLRQNRRTCSRPSPRPRKDRSQEGRRGRKTRRPARQRPPRPKAEKHANGTPKKDAQGNELDDKGQIVKKAEPAKAKTAAELDLKPRRRSSLGLEGAGPLRRGDHDAEGARGEIAELTEQMKPLQEARDAIIGIMEETGTSSDQLSAYLEFNRMLQSDQPKDLEAALEMVENQRGALYKALGREPAAAASICSPNSRTCSRRWPRRRSRARTRSSLPAGRRERAAADARKQQHGQKPAERRASEAARRRKCIERHHGVDRRSRQERHRLQGQGREAA